MFLDAVRSEFLTATSLLSRRAGDDYSPDQHLQTLPEYRRNDDPRTAPRSDKARNASAMQLFAKYIAAAQSAEGTITTRRVVFTTLDTYLAGRDLDALSDRDAQRWITSLVKYRKANLDRFTEGRGPMGCQAASHCAKSFRGLFSAGAEEGAAS
jgi:hypothetical protein